MKKPLFKFNRFINNLYDILNLEIIIENIMNRGVFMSIEKVREYFKQYNKENDIMEHEVSSATVELAAQAVGVIPARIA